jgi:hypothetical protein
MHMRTDHTYSLYVHADDTEHEYRLWLCVHAVHTYHNESSKHFMVCTFTYVSNRFKVHTRSFPQKPDERRHRPPRRPNAALCSPWSSLFQFQLFLRLAQHSESLPHCDLWISRRSEGLMHELPGHRLLSNAGKAWNQRILRFHKSLVRATCQDRHVKLGTMLSEHIGFDRPVGVAKQCIISSVPPAPVTTTICP